MNRTDWYRVMLEFARVQTYLFAVSELRAMVGANVLLGEVLRGRLMPDRNGFVKIISIPRNKTPVQSHRVEEGQPLDADNLPALAVQCGAVWPERCREG